MWLRAGYGARLPRLTPAEAGPLISLCTPVSPYGRWGSTKCLEQGLPLETGGVSSGDSGKQGDVTKRGNQWVSLWTHQHAH